MNNNRIYISERDAKRLQTLVELAPTIDARQKEYLTRLAGELNRAHVLPEDRLPGDVITMYSEVELEDLSDGEILTYTLVFPEEADASAGRISILAPIGTGMIGYRAGDEFQWETPGGIMRLRVRKVTPRPVPKPI